jgi:hypothetical protein
VHPRQGGAALGRHPQRGPRGESFGIKVAEPEVDFGAIFERRAKVVKTLTGGVTGLFKKNQIELIEGFGAVTDQGNVKIGGNFDGTEIEAKTVIIATGSIPKPIPGTQFGGRVIGTEEAWAFETLPARWPSSAPVPRARRSPARTRAWARRSTSSRAWTACCPPRTRTSPSSSSAG